MTAEILAILRYLIRLLKRRLEIKKLWEQDNGDWHWLKEKPTPIASLNRSVKSTLI